jgi:DNA-binding SARP family transcriptional activator
LTLLAALALRSSGVQRTSAAELLWPDCPRGRALANVRSAVWKGRRIRGCTLIDCDAQRLRLTQAVQVDYSIMMKRAHHIVGLDNESGPPDAGQEAIGGLCRALLPDWFDDWLLMDRERWDQVRLHALETLARRLMGSGRFLPALEAALAAVTIEPVRESAHRTVVEIHLAEGNSACALKHYHHYSRLVQRELGVSPSSQMARLIRPIASR